MGLVSALAQTFQVTEFDVLFFLGVATLVGAMYHYWQLHRVYEIAFGAIVGLGIYILLSVLLLQNTPIGTHGGLFPFGFSVVIVSIAVYLVFILAVLFPIHGGLVIAETTNRTVYTVQFIVVAIFVIFGLTSTLIYMIEQTYIFQVGTLFTWIKTIPYYTEVVRTSQVFSYIISHQDTIIPLGIILMLYKLLLSNLVSAVALSVWYNLSHVGFYRKKEDAAYRVEFHEVNGGHDDHGHGGGHDDHGHGGGSHDDHGHGGHDDHGHGGGHH